MIQLSHLYKKKITETQKNQIFENFKRNISSLHPSLNYSKNILKSNSEILFVS